MSKITSRDLIRCVRQAFSEEFEAHWVLFANGTVAKLPRTAADVWGGSMKMLREHQLSFLDDFVVQKLPGVEGWLVEIKEYAFYVYVHPSDVQILDDGSGLEIGQIGKEKFMEDAKTLQIAYVHLQPANR
jgi:hypothetical protein